MASQPEKLHIGFQFVVGTGVKRIALFLMTNLLVGAVVFAIASVFGVQYGNRGDLRYLAIYAMVYGMAGSLISLALSRTMAKWMMGVKLVSPQDYGPGGQIAREVHMLAERAGLKAMPEVGIYDSPEANAFATGPSQSRSLVAVSTGLLQQMPPDQVRAVLAHEIAHIKNGDMVTMALLQGVMNAFAIFLARLIASVVTPRDSDGRQSPIFYMLIVFVLQMVFTLLASLVTMAFSRYREFRADAGAAELTGAAPMVGALQTLGRIYQPYDEANGLQTAKIAGGGGFMAPFSSHPPLEKRIEALRSR